MGLSMSAIYAAIITKTNRLARVFKPDSAQRPRFITPRAQVFDFSLKFEFFLIFELFKIDKLHFQVGICISIVSVQLVGSIVWLLVDPPGTKIVFPSRTEAVLTCKVGVASSAVLQKTRHVFKLSFRRPPHIYWYRCCIIWCWSSPAPCTPSKHERFLKISTKRVISASLCTVPVYYGCLSVQSTSPHRIIFE